MAPNNSTAERDGNIDVSILNYCHYFEQHRFWWLDVIKIHVFFVCSFDFFCTQFTMDPSQYLELVIESLTHVETTVQLLRTAVTILYKHATFDSNQKIQTPNMMQLNTSRIAMASVNASLKPTRTQKPKPKPSRSTMINRNFGNENTQHSTDRTLRYSKGKVLFCSVSLCLDEVNTEDIWIYYV